MTIAAAKPFIGLIAQKSQYLESCNITIGLIDEKTNIAVDVVAVK